MYGLGIRLGYYIQFYAAAITNSIPIEGVEKLKQDKERDIRFLRIGNLSFLVALALATMASAGVGTLRPVDVYISLLFSTGHYLYLVPLFAWRAYTKFDEYKDPTRWVRVWTGTMYSILNYIVAIGTSAFQLWFWVTQAPYTSTPDCTAYGFAFCRVSLDNKAFRIVNLVLHSCLIFVASFYLCGESSILIKYVKRAHAGSAAQTPDPGQVQFAIPSSA